MPILAVQKSRESKPSINFAEYGEYYFNQDNVLGHLIVAQCLGDNVGGEIYKIPKFNGDASQLSGAEMKILLKDNTLYAKLLPWFGVKMVSHTTEGKPALVHVQHMPAEITVFKTSPAELEDWD